MSRARVPSTEGPRTRRRTGLVGWGIAGTTLLLVSWCLLGISLNIALYAFTQQYATYTLITHPESALPLGAAIPSAGVALWVPGATLTLVFTPLLFQPLRRRVQSIDDRRFNRARCDALRADLVRTTSTTMTPTLTPTLTPTHASLWLPSTEHRP